MVAEACQFGLLEIIVASLHIVAAFPDTPDSHPKTSVHAFAVKFIADVVLSKPYICEAESRASSWVPVIPAYGKRGKDVS